MNEETNKYLEKIAAFPNMSGIGGVVSKGLSMAGNQIHLALGGAYRDYALTKGITNPSTLANINGSRKGMINLRKGFKGTNTFKSLHNETLDANTFRGSKSEAMKGFYGDMSGLKSQTRNARLVVGGSALATIGGIKYLKNKKDERDMQSMTYPDYGNYQ